MNTNKILFEIEVLFFLVLLFISYNYSISIEIFFEKRQIRLQNFIDKNEPLTPYYFKYFLKNNISELYTNYRSLTPNTNDTQYYYLLPVHANGLPKKDIDYRDLVKIENVNIKHFTFFLNHDDKHEYETQPFLIETQNGPTIIDKKSKNKFTLIYGIGVTNPTSQLIREINAISHEDVAIIIFYNNKSNRTLLYNLFINEKKNPLFENVYFIDSPRFQADWGQITQAIIQLVITQAALKFFPKSLYISFHSEFDYPIVPNDIILKYLQRNYPNNYIKTLYSVDSLWKYKRKDEFNLFFDSNKIFNIESNKFVRMIKYLFPKKTVPEAKWRNGWNWYTMTLKDSKILIEYLFKRFDLVDTLEHTLNSDEVIFSTLVAEANISSTNRYLMFIDWKTHSCSPLIFTERYANEILNAKCDLWARKFKNNESNKVLDIIDNHIKNFNRKKFEKDCYI